MRGRKPRAFEHRAAFGERRAVGPVDRDRRDADAVVADRGEIGARDDRRFVERTPEPIIGSAARVAAPVDAIPIQLATLDGPADLADLGPRQVRHVEVEQGQRRQTSREDVASGLDGVRCGRRPVMVACVLGPRRGERDRHGRHADDRTFDRGGHGAGIVQIVAQIRAAVDAAHDEIGHASAQVVRADDDTIRGRTRTAIRRHRALAHARDLDRCLNRDRVADAARVAFGRDDGDLAEFSQRFGDGDQAEALIAVIVGDQDSSRRHDVQPRRLVRPSSRSRRWPTR